MKSTPKLPFFIYTANVIFMLATGLLFQFSNEFLPFHSDVIETAWSDVDSKSQILYLGMMRTEAAGFLASGTAIAIMLFFPFMKNEKWSYWAITIVGVVEYTPTFIANFHVSKISSASPPWQLMLFLIASLLIALALSLSFHKKVRANANNEGI